MNNLKQSKLEWDGGSDFSKQSPGMMNSRSIGAFIILSTNHKNKLKTYLKNENGKKNDDYSWKMNRMVIASHLPFGYKWQQNNINNDNRGQEYGDILFGESETENSSEKDAFRPEKGRFLRVVEEQGEEGKKPLLDGPEDSKALLKPLKSVKTRSLWNVLGSTIKKL